MSHARRAELASAVAARMSYTGGGGGIEQD
jgi:hypothetical protein